MTTMYNNHFSEYEEPNTWEESLSRVIEKYNQITSRAEMCRFINNNVMPNSNPMDEAITRECVSVAKNLLDTMTYQYNNRIYSEEV